MQATRLFLRITGQVQGVGFRPFVHRQATACGVTGFVQNSLEGVVVEAQGDAAALKKFCAALTEHAPAAARVEEVAKTEIPRVAGEEGFRIEASSLSGERSGLIRPDMAPCPDCLRDMGEAGNRRHKYAFTNCTACGPRFTITRSLPYDRQNTSMDVFPMCARCSGEYANPADRRFHAQPNACPQCGPHLWLVCVGPGGRPATGPDEAGATLQDALRGAAHLVRAGKIVALKGVGGFHLACDAAYAKGVRELRRRKDRKDKPLALMVRDLPAAERLAFLTDAEKELLLSPACPIVLCPMRPEARGLFDAQVNPDSPLVGLMLPSSPMHHAFFAEYARLAPEGKLPVLVMTSGNKKGAPLCSDNNQALSELAGIADGFLLHNRDILQPADDSVVRHVPGLAEAAGPESAVIHMRRARGHVPEPLSFPLRPGGRTGDLPVILGIGADLKNTLCLTHRDQAFVSQHMGDMENLEVMEFHRAVCKKLCALLRVRPEVVVHDFHPGYMGNVLAEEYRLPAHALQHHYAHAHAVLAEHRHQGPALAVTLDGTGYGLDGSLWGGEILLVNTETVEHTRLAHMEPMPLPGGESAILEPWRIAHGLLQNLGLPLAEELPWLKSQAAAVPLVSQMVRIKVNSPESVSCGRLFDAVSALLGLCETVHYEGQAAVRLEMAQAGEPAADEAGGAYACPFTPPGSGNETYILNTNTLFGEVYEDWYKGTPLPLIARRFHLGLALGLADLCRHLSDKLGVKEVGLSGGCFQNATLSALLAKALLDRGMKPLPHKKLPPNDGCISFGQAAWCRAALMAGVL